MAKDDQKPVIHRRGIEIRDKQMGKLRPAHGGAETVGVGRLDRAWGCWCGVPVPVVLLGELLSAGLLWGECVSRRVGGAAREFGEQRQQGRG